MRVPQLPLTDKKAPALFEAKPFGVIRRVFVFLGTLALLNIRVI